MGILELEQSVWALIKFVDLGWRNIREVVVTLPLVTLIITGLGNITSRVTTTTLLHIVTTRLSNFLVICNVSKVAVELDSYPLYIIEGRGKGCISVPLFASRYVIRNGTVYFVRVAQTLYSTSKSSIKLVTTDGALKVGSLVPYIVLLLEIIRRIRALEFEE